MQYAYPKVEVWKPIVGYEKQYEISNFGEIRRVNVQKRGLNNGYHSFNLSKNGKVKTYRLHVLVAAAFLGERPKGLVVDHIDGDKLNNCVSNLRYVTSNENNWRSHSGR